ncbi:MAG: o-succinylbenzoate synthase [Candidatus Zixiibacteriota bacterium]|nr:MAG: o-succinylbenzoate synthase [candidate division Zixibacteria bacterium]
MKISILKLYRYHLPLTNVLRTVKSESDRREGLLVELKDANGNIAYGEIAPLEGFSKENMPQAVEEVSSIRSRIIGDELPAGLEGLNGGFDLWFNRYSLSPSVRFGLESAVMELIARGKDQSLATLLGVARSAAIKVCGLLSGSTDDILSKARAAAESGFSCVKLKVGHLSVSEAAKVVGDVRNHLGNSSALRVDANRAFAIDHALEFMNRIKAFDVEYVEEPARNLNQLRKLLSEKPGSVGVALDESLSEIRPEDLSLGYHVKAIVIKPTMLGLERACRFARSAAANRIAAVISSSYESSVGMRVLAAMAAAFAPDVPAGLDTVDLFAEDLLEPPVRIAGGQIATECYDGPLHGLKPDLVEEITDG